MIKHCICVLPEVWLELRYWYIGANETNWQTFLDHLYDH